MTKCQNIGILVRDDAARDELRRQVGEIGLIMSVFSLPTLSFDVSLNVWIGHYTRAKALNLMTYIFLANYCVPIVSPLPFRSFFINSSRIPLWI